jgi:phage terminase Nu1 subunit (DNA packaging protein)
MKKAKPVAEMTVTAAELGALLGVSRQRCGQLAGEGVLVRVNGKFRLGESVARYISHLREDARRRTQSAATVRTQEARARSIELRNAEKERALIGLDESLNFVDLICGRVRMGAESLPAKIGERDLALRRRVDEHVRNYLQDLADFFSAESDRLRHGEAT